MTRERGALAVVLFGSLARGDATAASDADILVVLPESPLPFQDRIPSLLPEGLGVGVDLFPYTVEEAARAQREGWGVVRVALQEGRFLAGDAQELRRRLAEAGREGAKS